MNSYYAELRDITKDNDLILYGYTFREENMAKATIHCRDVAREMGVVPIPVRIKRISLDKHRLLAAKHPLPTLIDWVAHDDDVESRNSEVAS